jgi:glycosyltransferase involved in cell wall biosynthesis
MCISIDPHVGGAPESAAQISAELQRIGHDTTLLSFGVSDDSRDRVADLVMRLQMDGESVFLLKAPFPNYYGISMPWEIWRALRYVPKCDLMILHQVYTVSTIVGAISSWISGKPYIVAPHGSLDPFPEEHHRFRKRLFKFLIGNRILKRAEKIAVMHSSEQAHLPRNLRAKAFVLGLGVMPPVDNVNTVKSSSEVELLFMGRLAAGKRVDLLIAAMPSVLRVEPRVVLTIAGTGDKKLTSKLKALSTELGVDASIRFVGWIDGDMKENLLRTTYAFLLPSESENFAKAVGEALSFGVPCLVSRNVALSDLVAKYRAGIVIDTLTPAAVAHGILRLLASSHSEMSEGAKRAATVELQWSTVAQNWSACITEIVGKRETRR